MQAENEALGFSAAVGGNAAYLLEGFSTPELHLYDLSESLDPAILTGAVVEPDGSGYRLSFEDESSIDQPYLAWGEARIAEPASISRYQPDLRLLSSALGADMIVVAPAEFEAAILPLADHRRAEGLRVEVVRVEDIYSLFNGGVLHPRAIQDFLAYAYAHWQAPAPAYVLLVGDGHFNFKGYNPEVYGEPTPIYIPPYLEFADPFQGEVAVDTRYAEIVGDDALPDLAVGRLPANSTQEVEQIVAKIIGYESHPGGPWTGRLILAADDPDDAGDFEDVLNRLASDFLPAWLDPDRIYLRLYDESSAATQALLESWSQGVALLTYIGHGAVWRWADPPLLVNTQIDSLQPGHGLPFVITLGCLDGYWMMPPKFPGHTGTRVRSMAEWMLMAPDHGSIANFSPSGLGTVWAEQVMVRSMYAAMFDNGERRIGEIALTGQLAPADYLPRVMTLFGDPAARLRMPIDRVYLPLVRRGG
jgi:hypothetical protein